MEMNKRIFLIILGFNFYKQDEYYEKFNLTKSCLGYTGEDITYDEYLEAFKKTYEMIKNCYNQLLLKLTELNKWLTDKYSKQTYTKKEIRKAIIELGLYIDGFNGKIIFDE